MHGRWSSLTRANSLRFSPFSCRRPSPVRQPLAPLKLGIQRLQHRPASTLSALAFKPPSLQENHSYIMSNAQYGNFDLVKKHQVENTNVTISKWQSRVTGLTVVHIDYEGTLLMLFCTRLVFIVCWLAPIVKGYFAVATESKPQPIDGAYH